MTSPLPAIVVKGPTLDHAGPVWVGTMPGLGVVAVRADGSLDVDPQLPDDSGEKTRALKHGWGELLSHARRGHSLALGASVAPSDHAGALLVCGDAHDVAAMVVALAGRGWGLISDRPAPVSWAGERLVAHPRAAPLVLARQRAVEAGLAHADIRAGSNVVAVDLLRREVPTPVDALLLVQRRRPHEASFAELAGHRKFERAASMLLGGALAPDRSEDNLVAEHLRLAALPSAVVRIEAAADDVIDAVLSWWSA